MTQRQIMREVWHLAKPYWVSEEKRIAWGLLLAVVSLNLGSVCISVRMNEWNKAFYNAFQNFSTPELFRQFGVFCVLVVFAISISVSAASLNQMLYLRWRRWLTRKHLAAWLDQRAYYQPQLVSATDNPDQRISEDIGQFTAYLMSLSVGLISSVASFTSFITILWGLSGAAVIPLGSLGILRIPGFLVWAALLYAGIGTWITVRIGRPLVTLNFDRQRCEADFRFSLVRLRENAERVAIYGGEQVELGVFRHRYQSTFENFWRIMKPQRVLGWFTSGYAQVAPIVPMVLIARQYFAKMITLGGLMQVVNAFANVHSSLSFIISSCADIAALQAVTERLSGFDNLREDAPAAEPELPIKGQPEVYVSYAWGDDSSEPDRQRNEVVDRLCQTLAQEGWKVLRDCGVMHPGELISGFMKRIGRADRVIVVLSGKYLHSTYCMTELHSIYQQSLGEKEDFLQRIIPLTLIDARFDAFKHRDAYAEYWMMEFKTMDEYLRRLAMEQKLSRVALDDFRCYKEMQKWYLNVSDMLAYVNDVLHPHGFEAIVKDDFAALRRMLQRAGCCRQPRRCSPATGTSEPRVSAAGSA